MNHSNTKYWKFKNTESITIKTDRILGYSYDSEFLKIDPEGNITQKAREDRAFCWDGCTPKWSFFDLEFGTPDGRTLKDTGKPITWKASLFHDCLNQFAPKEISRKAIDLLFLDLLTEVDFKPRNIYYRTVRLAGGAFMKDRAK